MSEGDSVRSNKFRSMRQLASFMNISRYCIVKEISISYHISNIFNVPNPTAYQSVEKMRIDNPIEWEWGVEAWGLFQGLDLRSR